MDHLLWMGWLLAGCSGQRDDEPLPLRLAPLEENRASFPAPADGEKHPEVLSIVSGGDSALWWAHGRGYLHAPIEDCWASLADPEVVVDRREVDEWTVSTDIAPRFDVSFLVHNLVRDVLTVEYELTWLHELQAGTPQQPLRVVGTWSKTGGTPFIELLEGSFVLEPVSEEVTAIELIEHLDAALRDDATLVSYLEDLHASVVARVHGEPLPVW